MKNFEKGKKKTSSMKKIRKFILILYYNKIELKKYVKIALVELSFTVTQLLKKKYSFTHHHF